MTNRTNAARTDEERPAPNVGTIQIPLSRGLFATISAVDAPLVTPHKWHAVPRGNTFYAARRATMLLGKRRVVYMHRLILMPPDHADVDHINGDGLDNRRQNLRACTRTQNIANSRKQTSGPTSSRYKGVYWDGRLSRWRATIKPNGKSTYVGVFKSEEDAARAYDAAAIKHFGEFAVLNFPADPSLSPGSEGEGRV